MVTSWQGDRVGGWGRDISVGMEEWEVQIRGYETGSRMYCTTWGIQSIFCNNCKWKVTFKNSISFFKLLRILTK